jgi:hypothetical protein
MKENVATERMELRLTPQEKAYIHDRAKQMGLSMNQYIKVMAIQEEKPNCDLYQVYQIIKRNVELSRQQALIKQESYLMYIDKNGLKRVLEAARFSQFHTGDINMAEIRRIIKNFMDLFDTFPDDIKEIKAKGMKELQHCGIKNYLIKKLKITDQQMKSVKEQHDRMVQGASIKALVSHSESKVLTKRGKTKDGANIQTR